MKKTYFHRVLDLTPTKMWCNNVTAEEAQMALDAGAYGCTQNPAYTWKMLTHEDGKLNALKLLDETLSESDDDNVVLCRLQGKLIGEVAQQFLPLWEKTNGACGYVSIQGDPIHEEDPQVIIDEARRNREFSPNMMIKIPATAAGLEAMGVLIEENTPLNATEIMGMSQAVDVCEMYQKITAKTKKNPVMMVSLITGIYDEWIRKDVAEKGIEINPDVLYQAGMVIAKKVYQTMHDRGYPLGFIGGGVREHYHFTEMVGGDVNITMNWSDIDDLIKADQPVISRLFGPVQPAVEEELLEKLPQFRQAYFASGLKVEEYEEYGPVDFFRQSFIKAWKNALGVIAERRS